MEKLILKSYDEIVERMLEVANEGGTAYTICFFDDAIEIIKKLLANEETAIGGLDIAQEEYKGYNKEYFISVDGDYIVDVEPAWNDECKNPGYLWFDAEKVFVVGDACSAVIKCVDKAICTEIEFDFTEDNDDFFGKFLECSEFNFDEAGNISEIIIDLNALLEAISGE